MAAVASATLAGHMSPSQLATFTDCQARWWFKYGAGLPDPKTGNQALGIAVHEAIAYALEQKMETRREADPADAIEQFDVELDRALEEAELRDEESPAELRASGRGLVGKYVREAAPGISPAAVEVEVGGVVGGVWVAGTVDIVERNGRIRDIKTASSKRPLTHGQVLQLTTYVQLVEQSRRVLQLPAASGLVQIDALVRTKTPQLAHFSHRVTEEDLRATTTLYPLAQEVARAGYFVPNRGSTLCSRKNCAFWRACQREFGGEVL